MGNGPSRPSFNECDKETYNVKTWDHLYTRCQQCAPEEHHNRCANVHRGGENSCPEYCESFEEMGVPVCDYAPASANRTGDDWLSAANNQCGKHDKFRDAPAVCRSATGCPQHYTKKQGCRKFGDENNCNTSICVKEEWHEIRGLRKLVTTDRVREMESLSNEQVSTYEALTDYDVQDAGETGKKIIHDCCLGIRSGSECPDAYCGGNRGKCKTFLEGTKKGKFKDGFCRQIAQGSFPKVKVSGSNAYRTLTREELAKNLNELTEDTDLSMYKWLSDEYEACACYDTDRAQFEQVRQQLFLVDTAGTKLQNNLNNIDNLACWFPPCINSTSTMDWFHAKCPTGIQICVQNMNNQISAGGDVSIDRSKIANQQTCNFAVAGSSNTSPPTGTSLPLPPPQDSLLFGMSMERIVLIGIVALVLIVVLLLLALFKR